LFPGGGVFYLNKREKETMQKVILTTIVLMLISSVGYGADWKYFNSDADDNLWFYDTQGISREQDTVRVWVKFVLSDKTKKEYIKNFPKTPGMENTSHTKDRWEINCSKNIKRVLSSVWCDTEGNIIMDCSLLLSQGENVKYIQTQISHSSPTVTLNVYAHLMKGENQEAACRLENTIFEGTGHNLGTK
jgi:hypothetical protein